jgi:hypothetical protein
MSIMCDYSGTLENLVVTFIFIPNTSEVALQLLASIRLPRARLK